MLTEAVFVESYVTGNYARCRIVDVAALVYYATLVLAGILFTLSEKFLADINLIKN